MISRDDIEAFATECAASGCDETDLDWPLCEGCGCCDSCCNCTETDCDCDACIERREER
ncbi:hypothetical protein RCCWILLIS_21 [Rhodobacter phage RcCWillis]|nr:hypothetical protein RCCWILLIS_21 [Rhodobacter phage RcCWillis]